MLHQVDLRLGQPAIPAVYCNTYRRRFDIHRDEHKAARRPPGTGVSAEIVSAVTTFEAPVYRRRRWAQVLLGCWDRVDMAAPTGLRRLLQNALPIGIQYAYKLQWSCRLGSGEDGR